MADCVSLLDEELSSFVFNYLTENSGSPVRDFLRAGLQLSFPVCARVRSALVKTPPWVWERCSERTHERLAPASRAPHARLYCRFTWSYRNRVYFSKFARSLWLLSVPVWDIIVNAVGLFCRDSSDRKSLNGNDLSKVKERVASRARGCAGVVWTWTLRHVRQNRLLLNMN